MKEKKRKYKLYELLIMRGLAESEDFARKMVMEGRVYVDGNKADKAGYEYSEICELRVRDTAKWVSRGGYKLEAAIRKFGIHVKGRTCADVGVCTGGFTDVLLHSGAAKVFSIDTSRGDLHWKIRNNKNVVVMESTNYLDVHFEESIDVITIDVSLIPLHRILPHVAAWLKPDGEIIALLKPQYEVAETEREHGLVSDEAVYADIMRDLFAAASDKSIYITGVMNSPIRGKSGNREFLTWFTRDQSRLIDFEQVLPTLIKEEIQ